MLSLAAHCRQVAVHSSCHCAASTRSEGQRATAMRKIRVSGRIASTFWTGSSTQSLPFALADPRARGGGGTHHKARGAASLAGLAKWLAGSDEQVRGQGELAPGFGALQPGQQYTEAIESEVDACEGQPYKPRDSM